MIMPHFAGLTKPRKTDAIAELSRGFADIAPLSLGVATYGVAFGLLAARQGLDALTTAIMSALVFAGSAQIVAVERLAAASGPWLAVIAGLALNLRILLMTASLRQEFQGRPLWQQILGLHLTSDENWVLMHATRNRGKAAGYCYLVGGGSSLILSWIVATGLAAAFARYLPDLGRTGMDFAFTSAFILLLTSLWCGRQSISPWLISGLIAAGWTLFIPLDPSAGLICGALAGAVWAGLREQD
jgi:4-azaleucine resistance transporter AzlC